MFNLYIFPFTEKTWITMIISEPHRNPTKSNITPPIDGPMKAPRAKADAHSPETIAYVEISSANPFFLYTEQKISHLYK